MLVGVVTDNQGFSSNADEIEVASKYFYNIAIKPFQELIIEGVDQILAFNSISLDLYFRRLNLLEDIEEKQQAEEEEVAFGSQIEDLLAEFGEDEDLENWVLVDEREVDYELEDELDKVIEDANEKLTEKTSLLSKIWNFVSQSRSGYGLPEYSYLVLK